MTGVLDVSGGGDLAAVALPDHWTDLANYTDSVRNVMARPGTFSTLFPETTDDNLVQLLQDALAECHMERTLLPHESDDNGFVRPVMTSGAMALVVLYAGLRLVRAELLNRITSAKYVAGPVSAETTYATNVLRDVMKALEAQKEKITYLMSSAGANAAFYMADAYVANATGFTPNAIPGTLRPGSATVESFFASW